MEETETIVQMIKRNSSDYTIDGNNGDENEQDIYLWTENEDYVNQQWIEIDRGDGYYSYQKVDTNYCIYGDTGGANRQNVYLWECDENVQSQHWLKVNRGDGNNGGDDGQSIYLRTVDEDNQNQQWLFTEL